MQRPGDHRGFGSHGPASQPGEQTHAVQGPQRVPAGRFQEKWAAAQSTQALTAIKIAPKLSSAARLSRLAAVFTAQNATNRGAAH